MRVSRRTPERGMEGALRPVPRRRASGHPGYASALVMLLAAVTILGTSVAPVYPQGAVEVAAQARPSVAFVLAKGDRQTISGSAFVVEWAQRLATGLSQALPDSKFHTF